MIATQQEVVDYYENASGIEGVATVGEYVRVVTGNNTKTCYGPLKDEEKHNWKVVEIDWENRDFLLAPEDYNDD